MRRFLALFTHNWQLKIFSLLISVALFYFVRSDKDSEGTLVVEINYTNPPKDQVLLNELIHSVKLSIRGPWMGVRKLDGETWHRKLTVDLSNIKGDRVDLDSTMFGLPKGIRITNIMPQYLPIRLEQRITRTVPITLKLENNPNFHVTETAIDPNKVKLSGPKTLVLSLPSLPLPSYAVQKEGSNEFSLPLPELPPNIEVQPNVKEVKVRIVAEKSFSARQYTRIPITVKGYKGKYLLEPKTVDVAIEGSTKGMRSFNSASIVPVIDLSQKTTEKEFYVPVTLQKLPAEFHSRILPTQVKVRLLP
ncbi:MAG: hypothetical protein CVU53_06495 [Deltaproteobacteria bacterium HGW-Deltaproteobacteria-11]|nr:MAG: hypothetical protein CVU53_06495 [Deltaproteobacteria bacterium HGW-Deltaproteobacteria-11]